MKLTYPAFSETITIGADLVPSLILESRTLFRELICDIATAIDGMKTDLVLSIGDHIVDISKTVELITNFICFDINKKTLINKIIAELEKVSVSPEYYVKTQALLAEIERSVGEWAFSFPCDIIPSKISASTLLKSVGIELRNDYEGHEGEVEKILDYMELVREFDRDKLFVTVNLRSYFNDDVVERFLETVIAHEYKVLMLESQAYPRLSLEKRRTIDADLCEF